MDWRDLWRKNKWLIIFFSVVAALLALDKFVPRRQTIERGSEMHGPVRVKYMFKGPEMVPYEPIGPVISGKPLWALKTPDKTPPQPRVSGFKTSISRQSMTATTGYDGGCELPKIDRTQTNASFCLQCHEQHGVTSPSSTPIRLDSSHPVAKSIPFGSPEYQQTCDPNLVMVDGVMQCTTCHDYWSTPRWPKWVAMDPSNLCQSCHNK